MAAQITGLSFHHEGPTKHVSVEETSTSNLDFTVYEDRLKSFKDWPNKDVPEEELARAGFFYKQKGDVVQCPFCNIEGYSWVKGDDPMQDHRDWKPNCPFVMSVEHDSTERRAPEDTCGLYGIEILPNSVIEDQQLNFQRLGIHKNKPAKYPDKCTKESRLATFAAWPKSMNQKPDQLSEAGFFYVGTGDQTLCFHCGGGLKDWEPNDDPWEEHAMWFPRCQYLCLKKNTEFIAQAKERRASKQDLALAQQTKEEAQPEKAPEKTEDTRPAPESQTLCKICYTSEVGVVFLPCGHIVSCVDCASGLKTCPLCRKPLEATFRAFLS